MAQVARVDDESGGSALRISRDLCEELGLMWVLGWQMWGSALTCHMKLLHAARRCYLPEATSSIQASSDDC